MNEKHLTRLTSTWPGVASDVKWDDDLIFSVAGKMFCGLCLRGAETGKLSFKVEPERFLEFTDRPGFRPAPYMARAHWVTLDDPAVVPRAELDGLLRRAYELVRAKLPKKTQRELAD
jgi:predicted DNA-binding protein (MmcQ/YjbR family)